jgi:methionyl aminopeptidase
MFFKNFFQFCKMGRGPIQIKSRAELELMRTANLVVREVLETLREMVSPGVTTYDLDQKARELSKKHNATPAFLNYVPKGSSLPPFPGVICSSVNEVIVHGIPNHQPLKEGDVVSVDYGCFVNGFCGDSATTIPVGKIIPRTAQLLEITQLALQDAIGQCYAGKRIGDIASAVQGRVEKYGFGVVREFVGHGIGRNMHEPPHVPNFGIKGKGILLRPGMVLAIEPMITAGSYQVQVLDDGWTAVTKDGSISAHFEHSVAITNSEPYVLSKL